MRYFFLFYLQAVYFHITFAPEILTIETHFPFNYTIHVFIQVSNNY